MSPTRRDALTQLSALLALPLVDWRSRLGDAIGEPLGDPLGGTIAEYQAGRLRGDWSAVEVTTLALARCTTWGSALHAIDRLSASALDEARASDVRARRPRMRGPVDGVPVFAKSIYDMAAFPTTASSADWAGEIPTRCFRAANLPAKVRDADCRFVRPGQPHVTRSLAQGHASTWLLAV